MVLWRFLDLSDSPVTLVPLSDTLLELSPFSDDLIDDLDTLPVLLVALVDVFLDEEDTELQVFLSSPLRGLELFSEDVCNRCCCCCPRVELLAEDLEL